MDGGERGHGPWVRLDGGKILAFAARQGLYRVELSSKSGFIGMISLDSLDRRILERLAQQD